MRLATVVGDDAMGMRLRTARDTQTLGILTLLSLLVGLLYVFAVRAGTPYDEPAHFNVVQLYRASLRMPVMGAPGTQYEAYQPPLYYVVMSFVARAVGFADEATTFHVVRVASLLLYLPSIGLVYLLAQHLGGSRRLFPVACALFIALSPSLLAIVSSVQNDGLAITLSLLTTLLCVRWVAKAELTYRTTVLLAACASLALLTKLNAAFLVVCTPLFMWYVHRQRAWKYIAVFVTTVALLTGWWFLRNLHLYGDLTAEKAERSVVPETSAYHQYNPLHPSDTFDIIRSILTYWWVPVEYYRNLFHTPKWVIGLIGVFTLYGLGGVVVFCRERWRTPTASSRIPRRVGQLLALQYGAYMLLYLMVCHRVWIVPAQITLVCLMVPALVVGGGGLWASARLSARGPLLFLAALAACLLVMNAAMLWMVYRIPFEPFNGVV